MRKYTGLTEKDRLKLWFDTVTERLRKYHGEELAQIVSIRNTIQEEGSEAPYDVIATLMAIDQFEASFSGQDAAEEYEMAMAGEAILAAAKD